MTPITNSLRNNAAAIAIAFGLMATPLALINNATPAHAQVVQTQRQAGNMIKTRLDHFAGTDFVLVVSYLPSEITSITCEKWAMMGIKSWRDQNNFTIPAGPAVAVMLTKGFDGYCKAHGSIVAHTDDGDFVGTLDRGDGNWTDSTKLTFTGVQK